MGEAAGIVGGSTTIRPGPRVIALLGIATLVSLIFIAIAALPYFSLNEAQFRTYWPRRGWLLLHITTGIVAILTGPVQLWLGLSDRHPAIHRRLGLVYLGSITVSSVAAYYLALHTDGVAVGLERQKVAGWLATDPMFDGLKGDPEYESLL